MQVMEPDKKENHQQGATYIEADISHEYNCYDYPDIIFHLAAKARIGPSFKNPEKYIKTNYEGTYNNYPQHEEFYI